MDKVSNKLRARAIKLGLCSDWQKDWVNKSKDELCEMFVRGIDFCIVNDYPSTTYMKKNFDGVMQNHGIYVDEKVSVYRPKLKTFVVNGKSDFNINVEDFDVCEIYVRHNSKVTVNIKGQARIFINIFDKSSVTINQSNSLSKAIVYNYSNNTDIYKNGVNIVVRKGKME